MTKREEQILVDMNVKASEECLLYLRKREPVPDTLLIRVDVIGEIIDAFANLKNNNG